MIYMDAISFLYKIPALSGILPESDVIMFDKADRAQNIKIPFEMSNKIPSFAVA